MKPQIYEAKPGALAEIRDLLVKKAAANKPTPTSISSLLQTIIDSPKLGIVSGVAAAGYAAKSMYDKIKNDQKRRAMFETLCSDPAFQKLSKETLLEWYATITHFAPDVALDKIATKELIRQFMTFGKIDFQTLKTLAETQKAVSEARDKDRFKLNLFW